MLVFTTWPGRWVPPRPAIGRAVTDIILGVIGKAQDLHKMTILAFVVVRTHERSLLSWSAAEELSWQSIRDGLPKAAR